MSQQEITDRTQKCQQQILTVFTCGSPNVDRIIEDLRIEIKLLSALKPDESIEYKIKRFKM